MKTKDELLKHYSNREPHLFYQMDGFFEPDGGDDVMHPDDDGDCLCSSETCELMTGITSVRVLITPATDKKTAIRQLEKIIDWIKRDEHFMQGIRRKHETEKKMGIIFNMLQAQGYTIDDISSLAEMAAPNKCEKCRDCVPF